MTFPGLFDRLVIHPRFSGTAPAFNNNNMTSSGVTTGWVFPAPATDTITHIWTRIPTVVTPPTYRVALQTVSSGLPSGAELASGSGGNFQPSATGGLWVALDTPCAITRGVDIAVNTSYVSGTIGGSNGIILSMNLTQTYHVNMARPYATTNSGKSATFSLPIFALKSATRIYGNPINDVLSLTANTDGHRVAQKFSLPANVASAKIKGFSLSMSSPATASSIKVGLWDAAGTLLQGNTIDTNNFRDAAQAFRSLDFPFAGTLATLAPETDYCIGVERDGVNLDVGSLVFGATDDLRAFEGGPDFHAATWNGSAWTQETLRRIGVELVFDEIVFASGGGSSGTRVSPFVG
jgi:hypothetical protein